MNGLSEFIQRPYIRIGGVWVYQLLVSVYKEGENE